MTGARPSSEFDTRCCIKGILRDRYHLELQGRNNDRDP